MANTIYTPSDYQLAVDYELKTRGNWTDEEWKARNHELFDVYAKPEDREFLHKLIDVGWC